jgi:hypothetical protein
MILTIYQSVAFLVVAAIASFIFYNEKRGHYISFVGWKRIPTGMVMATAGIEVGNLKVLLHDATMKSQK